MPAPRAAHARAPAEGAPGVERHRGQPAGGQGAARQRRGLRQAGRRLPDLFARAGPGRSRGRQPDAGAGDPGGGRRAGRGAAAGRADPAGVSPQHPATAERGRRAL
ncbi:hypothetical protein G6F32_015225 [Rhizopus arrhizus]|nr:hypothetical protein G6F32_015225 [Rhizopus arrhizus]